MFVFVTRALTRYIARLDIEDYLITISQICMNLLVGNPPPVSDSFSLSLLCTMITILSLYLFGKPNRSAVREEGTKLKWETHENEHY